MGWNKREALSNLVILGDDEGTVRKTGGLLASITQDTTYPNRMNYELVQKNGDSIHLAGSASLGRQIAPGDVGKFLKAEFVGWGKSANGKFKMIDVSVYEGEPTEDMKKWPRYKELHTKSAPTKIATTASVAIETDTDIPPEFDDDDGDDDLPFN